MAKSQDERIVRRIEQRIVQATIQSFSGPLPPPEILAKYNECVQDGAKRLIEMAERQAAHRQKIEMRVITWSTLDQRIGLFLAFTVAMAIGVGGFWLIVHGKDATGLAAVITAIAAPAGIFIFGKRKQDKERADKASSFPTFTK